MASTLMKWKGAGDLIVAGILTLKPSLMYASVVTRTLASWTGLHLSSAEVAPGFNQSIACLVAAVGVGHVVAASSGPAARPAIFAMNLTWAVLGFMTCLTPLEWGLGSATLLMSSLNHASFSLALYLLDGEVIRGKGVDGPRKKGL
ncbi:hypothetical protein BDZ94DRAFT_1308628 [Collybia nuda]|uniref:Uncharacterized protein n=1 Tax=Collybia nuda TaxID=64659 RepID=A0A9P6CF61_9AGAR|nr:hypothetical protein BDZ94DRAFT_1308628 [Collybia nuda]